MAEELNKELTDTLTEWAVTLEVQPASLLEEAKILVEENERKGKTLENQDILKRIQRRRKGMRHLKAFKGIILNKSPIVDLVENSRKSALSSLAKDPETAKALELVNEEGKPLWSQKTCNWLTEDDNRVGKLMPEHLYTISTYGIVLTGDGYRPFRLRTSNENSIKKIDALVRHKWYAFEALDRHPKLLFKDLRASKYTTYQEVDGIGILEALETEDMKIFYHSLEELNELLKQKKKGLVIIRGYASNIARKPTKQGSYILSIDDTSTGVAGDSITCWVPSTIPMEFGVGTDLIVMGWLRAGKKRNSDEASADEEIPQLNVYSLYPTRIEPISEEE